jgi:hypothetical protein
MTLVELMIAMVLGLIISGSMMGVYLNSVRNFAQDENIARMQENARYAIGVLSEDLMMADFWGPNTSVDVLTTSLAPTTGDCGEAVNLFSAAEPVQHNRYQAASDEQFDPCPAIDDDRLAQGDMVMIKRVKGSPTARTFVDTADTDGDGDTAEVLQEGLSSLANGTVYLRTNGTSLTLINDANSLNPPPTGFADWEYLPRLYFVRDHYEAPDDGIPALCRRELNGINLSRTRCLAEGIENLHIEYGVDSDVDGTPDFYTATPDDDDMRLLSSARIHLLARSAEEDPFYQDTRSYRLGDVVVAAANDGYFRKVLTTTVSLRNPISRVLLR